MVYALALMGGTDKAAPKEVVYLLLFLSHSLPLSIYKYINIYIYVCVCYLALRGRYIPNVN